MEKLQSPDFSLSENLTPAQLDFFDTNGVLHFKNFLDRKTVNLFLGEIKRIERQLLEQGTEKINGVPFGIYSTI